MRKLLHKLKDRFEDHTRSPAPTADVVQVQSREFLNEQYMYRYRKQRGVNLGTYRHHAKDNQEIQPFCLS